MMDELELLKKDWQKKEEQLPKLSYDEIYQMTWQKSSTIVKKIFYISIVELLFWIILNTIPFFSQSYKDKFGQLKSESGEMLFIVLSSSLTYIVLSIFIYYLYKSYKAISVVDNVKSLMESILRTRKIIRYYVGYNLVMAFIIALVTFYMLITQDEKVIAMLGTLEGDMSSFKMWLFIGLFALLGVVIMLAFIWGFYRLIYGILLKKLKRNYNELKRLEI
ncbi:hypothetical protein [Spongiimicrobium salis]|uniref:hypothetical protein n=1 Tax=Spongiimicrobium salis TaxID=1667022 RepID=UPI00374CA88A